ncbi:MAG: amino acid ABC transporter [Devosia sp. 67-54]|uniref:amino acid ABC transporter permease n=1 Tax=unclassified Devosia TaxID=196773 RepID=UPI00095BBAB7|nr:MULTISPECIES: amino acid ABC transporter permease [unclassified Devosia]MBN9304835.1 amino acid ABC transporter permease [Devosia sp.]OJX15209.1 MAG: amino acid ABC transporter [Devosia sp. 67-54]
MQDRHRRRLADFPYWLLAIALLGIVALWAIVADGDYTRIFRALSGGVLTTMWVTLVAFALAILLGLAVALMRTSGRALLVQLATFYTELVRGIPILVFLFYIAFVGAPATIVAANWLTAPLQQFGWMPALTVRNFDLTWRAIVALTICYSAFLAEIFRAGIEAVPEGQLEAARAMGLSRGQIFRRIVAPQAFRIILPPLGNDFVSMIKDSALVSSLGVQDITQLGKVYSAATFKFFETYNVVAFLYLTMTISLSLVVRYIEHRMKR